jgi:hypothetical protein
MQIVNALLEPNELNLNEAQSIACQLVMNIIKENYHTDMTCVQIEWFYGKSNWNKFDSTFVFFLCL